MAQRRDGDWDCPSCGDMNFASRQQCRKCNTPKAQGGGFRGTLNNGAASYGGGGTFGGGSFGGGGYQGGGFHMRGGLQGWHSGGHPHHDTKPGDWYCPSCNDLNFASREICRKCGTPHPPFSDPTIGTKPGDWYCPSCGDLNFASRVNCRKCNTAHPGGLDPALRIVPFQSMHPYTNVKPGDWHCPSCGDLNFASRQVCRMCNAVRANDQHLLGVKPGDWFCPNCNDLNFASRTQCRKCNTPKLEELGDQGHHHHDNGIQLDNDESDSLHHIGVDNHTEHRTNIERIEQMGTGMD